MIFTPLNWNIPQELILTANAAVTGTTTLFVQQTALPPKQYPESTSFEVMPITVAPLVRVDVPANSFLVVGGSGASMVVTLEKDLTYPIDVSFALPGYDILTTPRAGLTLAAGLPRGTTIVVPVLTLSGGPPSGLASVSLSIQSPPGTNYESGVTLTNMAVIPVVQAQDTLTISQPYASGNVNLFVGEIPPPLNLALQAPVGATVDLSLPTGLAATSGTELYFSTANATQPESSTFARVDAALNGTLTAAVSYANGTAITFPIASVTVSDLLDVSLSPSTLTVNADGTSSPISVTVTLAQDLVAPLQVRIVLNGYSFVFAPGSDLVQFGAGDRANATGTTTLSLAAPPYPLTQWPAGTFDVQLVLGGGAPYAGRVLANFGSVEIDIAP